MNTRKMGKTQEKIDLSINKKEQIYQIIRSFLLIIYGCAFPFAVLQAMAFPFLVDYVSNDTIFWLLTFYLISIPVTIVITMVAALRFNKKSFIWFSLPILAFGLFLLSSKVADVVRERDYNAKQPVPLSQRGLPLPATDVPITLPPDPGEAGKTTLAGIDFNNDGVRDDLEREIVYMYPQNEQVRRVLRAMVKKEQMLVANIYEDVSFTEKLWYSYFAFEDCYNYMAYGLKVEDRANTDILYNMAKNTSARKKKYIENDKYSRSSPTISGPEACTQPLVKGQF